MSHATSIIIYGASVLALTAACDASDPGGVELASPADAPDLDPDARVVHVRLEAREGPVRIGGREVVAWSYGGQVPGPTVRARVGDTIVVDLDNGLAAPTTVHWHGMHVPWQVDGVTWMQAPIGPGEARRVSFVADRAGTFWYHPHFDSAREVDRGLYGAVVVEDPAEAPADELVLVFDTWDEEAGAAAPDAEADHAHGGVDDRRRAWIVNGLSYPTVRARRGALVRARVVNASNTGYLALAGGAPALIATDQGLASAATTPASIVLAPGDRVELAYRMPAEGDGFDVVTTGYTMHGGALDGTTPEHDPSHGAGDVPSTPSDPAATTGTPLFHVALDGPSRAPPVELPWAFDQASPTPDPGTTDVLWVLQGSDLGWMINGETFPDVTIPEVTLGADVVIELRNLSPTHHPFHLHGMAFEVLARDGVAPATRELEDTIDLPIRGVARLLLRADNPGEWMAHCHILPHAHGMMTVLRVAEP